VRDNETFGLVIDNSIALVRGCEIARNGAYISGPDFKEYAGGMTGLGQSQITVEDCQISENRAKQSGGIRISGGVLEMSNCSVFDNIGAMGGSWGVGWGAGVYVDGGELSMLDCQVYSNRANWPHSGPLGAGGGICVCEGTAHLERCVVEDNEAGHAGGLELSNAVSTLVECRIHGNSAGSEGGGVRVTTAGTSQASLTLTRCEVDGNASTRGAGVFSRDAEIIVNECEVTDNYATERGGGWFVTGVRGSVVVQDSEIRGNMAWDTSVSESQSSGGAIFCEAGSSAEVARCEFKWNYGQYAGGAACVSGASLELIESMFHDHFAGNLGGTILIENGGVMEMARCMVMSGNTDSGGSGGGLYVAAGSSNTARIEASTFCGNEVGGSMHNVEPSDIQNIVGPWTDAGGNEIRDWCVLSVDDDGADDPDAEFASIQQALEVLPEYWDIEVHPGRYVGTGNEVVNIDSRGRGTRIVAVAGPEFTVIDGEGARCGVRCLGDLPEEGSNAWDNVAIEGFSIVNGSAPSGGGVLTSGTRLSLKDCILADNAATWVGGGLLNSTHSPVILSSCQILRNRANTWYGGGICCKGDLTMRDCEIIDNSAQSWSGGVQVGTGEVDIRDCRFSGNRGRSGAALGIGHGTGTVVNCEFMGNIASYMAGAVYCTSASTLIKDCRIARNESLFYGGLYCEADGEFQVQSSEFCGNLPNNIDGSWTDLGDNRLSEACCDADVNGDAIVDATDLYDLMQAWGPCDGCGADVVQSASVDIEDLLFLLANWGSACQG